MFTHWDSFSTRVCAKDRWLGLPPARAFFVGCLTILFCGDALFYGQQCAAQPVPRYGGGYRYQRYPGVIPGYAPGYLTVTSSVQQRERPVSIGDNPYPVSGVGAPNRWVTTDAVRVNYPALYPGYYVHHHGHGHYGNGYPGAGFYPTGYPGYGYVGVGPYWGYGPYSQFTYNGNSWSGPVSQYLHGYRGGYGYYRNPGYVFAPQPIGFGIVTPGYLSTGIHFGAGGYGYPYQPYAGVNYGYSSYQSQSIGPFVGRSRVAEFVETQNAPALLRRPPIRRDPNLDLASAEEEAENAENVRQRADSSARTGARSLAAIKAEKSKEKAAAQQKGLDLLEKAKSARGRGDLGLAKLYFRMASEVLGHSHPDVAAGLAEISEAEQQKQQKNP